MRLSPITDGTTPNRSALHHATMRFLHLIRPLAGFLPVVESPKRKVPFPEKIQLTLLCLLLYFVMSNLPLYGVERAVPQNDPFYWM